MATAEFELLNKRRAAIAQERARLREEIAKIEQHRRKLIAEEEELTRVEQALTRWASDTVEEEVPVREPPPSTDPNPSIPRSGPPRPKGIPTTREMINTVLRDAEQRGQEGLLGRDLVLAISKRWWPGCGWNDVLPTALLLVKKQQLGRNKRNKLFVRLRERPEDGSLNDATAHAAE